MHYIYGVSSVNVLNAVICDFNSVMIFRCVTVFHVFNQALEPLLAIYSVV
jgi:hypothetical protein